MKSSETQRLTQWAFVLAVADLQASACYFRDILGFRIQWEEGADWRLAERDGVRLMLGHCPHDPQPSDIGAHSWFGYIEVVDVDALRDEFLARGAQCGSFMDQPYGMREFVLTTIDGHRIFFGQQFQSDVQIYQYSNRTTL